MYNEITTNVRTNLYNGKVEIGLDESKSCLYGVVLDQTTKRIGIQHLGHIKTLLDEENK